MSAVLQSPAARDYARAERAVRELLIAKGYEVHGIVRRSSINWAVSTISSRTRASLVRK